jgi:hypothetical protein
MRTVVPTTAVSSPVRDPVDHTASAKQTRTANKTMESPLESSVRPEPHLAAAAGAAIAGSHIAAIAPNALPSSSVPAARPSPP